MPSTSEVVELRALCPDCDKRTVTKLENGTEKCDDCGYEIGSPMVEETTTEVAALPSGPSYLVTLADVIPELLKEFQPKPPHLMDLGDALDEYGREVKWVVHRLFAEGDSSLLTARPGIGKSWFAQQLAVSIALGRPFLGRDVKQGLVIYFAFEGPQQTVRRLHRLGLPKVCDNFKIWTAATDGTAPAVWLEKIVEKRKPVLIILDCLQNIAQTKEGNSYSETYKLLAPLVQYAVRTKTHVHALHHSSAKEERAGIGSALGSTAIPANFGTVLHLRRLDPHNPDGSAPRVLECAEKHRFGLMGTADIPTVVLTANPFTAELSVTGSFAEASVQQAGLNIIRTLAQATAPMAREELLDAASIRKASFEKLLARLMQAGAVKRTPTGRKNQHLYSTGPTGEKEWTASFLDRGASAFDPPSVQDEAPVQIEASATPESTDF